MNLKRYQNELIAVLAFLLMLTGFVYKNAQLASQAQSAASAREAVSELKEVIALKKVWADKKTSQKIDKLKTLVPASKITWSKKGKKVTAVYKGLNAKELNKLVSKLLSLPVMITELDIKKTDATYHVEFKCKW